MKIFTALFFAVSFYAAAQRPEVPHKMSFANLTLTIRDEARREIQKDVDALTQSPKHFNIKADRARTYFPIIEKIFAEEGVPDDFKYLVLQESALIADAVSVSKAVGFWQFKDFTAMEMGLRVDKDIDERMNIAASTRAAARYIKKNNTLFDNWLYALQSYQMGAGGVMNSEPDTHAGATHAEITSKTYWYVKKFLAYKIAFQDAVNGKGQTELTLYENTSRKTLSDLSRELSVDETALKNYNKWVRSDEIPADRKYYVLVPFPTGITLPAVTASSPGTTIAAVKEAPKPIVKFNKMRINGVPVIEALPGEDAVAIAARAGVDLSAFLKWNDIPNSAEVVSGGFYFLGKKRARAVEDFHTVVKGESLWSISQKYGVQLKKLKKYNRLHTSFVEQGVTLYLSSMKPKEDDKQVTRVVEVVHEEPLNWSATPSEPTNSPAKTEPPTPQPVASSERTITPGFSAQTEVADSSKTLQLANQIEVRTDTAHIVVSTAPQPVNGEHVVQPKETLYAIAKIYNVGVMDLVEWNNLDLQQGIKIGQILKVSSGAVPSESPVSAKEVLHEVKSSDTLYSIARKYGVTIKDLMDWNEKKDFSLSVGEKLKIKAVQ
ncbi:MAG TPA: LysM peptidoglycan-binding domain-containing protein [Chryseosolibacter sp.]|nr:LysM peptidoglycan-binding domain-containing protein [Chryseosolibacter sp.]